MSSRDALQLGVCLLFPLSYVTFLLWTTGRHHGRTPREIITTLGGIVGCVLGIVVIGLALNASRGHALFELHPTDVGGLRVPAPGVVGLRPVDAGGLLACGGLLWLALRLGRKLTHGGPVPKPDDEAPQS